MAKQSLFSTNKTAFADSVLNANKNIDWVKRLYEKNAPSIQVPGGPARSTHLMADDGKGYVYPTIIRQNGKLVHLTEDQAYDYAHKTSTGIQLPQEQGSWFAANGYKQGTGVLNNIAPNGVPFNNPGYKVPQMSSNFIGAPKVMQQDNTAAVKKFENGGKMGKFATYKDDRPKVKGSLVKARKMAWGGGAAAQDIDPSTGMPWTKGISSVAGFGAATVDAFAPTDAYGVRSNGAALGSGALKGAASGAEAGMMFGPEGALIGAGVGAVVGGVSGVLGNKKANWEKTDAINKSTTAQIASMQAASGARVAADPSLRYGNSNASYYRFGGVMKGNGPTPPRMSKPLAAVEAKPRLMPNITEAPNRQISRMGAGGIPPVPGTSSALKYNTGKLFKGGKSYKSQIHSMAAGGKVEPLSSEDTKFNGASHANGGIKFPQQGVEVEGGETANKDFIFSKKLGYAKKHEEVARQMGKAEQRPDSPLNQATKTALQRKTELLKQQQEAHKASLGMPNDLNKMASGGVVDPAKPAYDPTKQPTYDPTLLTDGKFLVSKPDGKLGQWGNPIPAVPAPVPVFPGKPVIPLSDKARGKDNAYNTARNQQTGKAVPTIHSNYKFGGKMKKMGNGGPRNTDPVTDPTLPVPPLALTSSNKTGVADKIANTANDLVPFLGNFVNATQKLPLPPVPILNTEITPNIVDYSASRNEAVRATRGANKTARENLNSGAAVAATAAANLAGQDRAIGQANEAEQNTNAQIRNSAAAENAQIKASNNLLTNNYQNELTARKLKQQQLTSQNVANITEKLQGMKRDKSLNDLEAQKAILGWMQNNNTGAGWEAVRPIVAKHVSAEALKSLDKHNETLREYQRQDREDNRTAGNYGIFAKAMNYDPKNMTPEAYQAWLLNTRGGNIAPGRTKLGSVTTKDGNTTYKTTE